VQVLLETIKDIEHRVSNIRGCDKKCRLIKDTVNLIDVVYRLTEAYDANIQSKISKLVIQNKFDKIDEIKANHRRFAEDLAKIVEDNNISNAK